jgi:succinoglycan biosynthesis protein ExoW
VNARPTVGVVIPYYQRVPGTLARALRSIAAQTHLAGVQVVVVDDASPVPAAEEVAQAGELGAPITVLAQANAGPGAARNRGLDHLAGQVDCIAFLDSDDEWRPQHLERALEALDAGHDVFFSNLVQLDQHVSAFERRQHLPAERHPSIADSLVLRSFQGNMIDQIVTGNVIGTPTVVYRFLTSKSIRFRPEYRNAGEDYLMWLEMASQGARFAFSTEVGVDCGRGVNVYSGSGWGTEGHARRVHDELRYRLCTLREFPLSKPAHAHVRREVRRLSRVMLLDLLHRLRHGKAIDWRLVAATFTLRPTWLLFAALPSSLG